MSQRYLRIASHMPSRSAITAAKKLGLVAAIVMALSACSWVGTKPSEAEEQLAAQNQQIKQLREDLARQAEQLKAQQRAQRQLAAKLQDKPATATATASTSSADASLYNQGVNRSAASQVARPTISGTTATRTAAVPATNQPDGMSMPPNAKPGECYARVIVPAKYDTVTGPVMVAPATEKIDIIPAQYATREKQIIVREASTRIEVVPATYKIVTEKVLVKPGSTKVVQAPAEYKTVTEDVVIKPAYTTWKRSSAIDSGEGVGSAVSGAAAQIKRYNDSGYTVLDSKLESTGDVMCLVEVPAVVRTVTRKILVRPAGPRTIEIPAEYKTVSKQVIDKPATTRKVVIPAEYRTITVQDEVRPEQRVVTPIPAQYETQSREVEVTPQSVQWPPVLCAGNMTPANIAAVQRELIRQAASCWPCKPKVDGVIGQCTYQAAQCYAEKRNLPHGDNFLTLEVIRSLGVNIQ